RPLQPPRSRRGGERGGRGQEPTPDPGRSREGRRGGRGCRRAPVREAGIDWCASLSARRVGLAMPVTSDSRVALYLQDKHPIRDGMGFARYAEERGFEAVWQAESRLVREATVPMAAYAAVTDRIKIGSGVVNNWTRNVGLLAATFSTLDDLAPGRVMLGVGAWWDPLAAKVGIRRRKPLQAMREYVEVTRRLLAMENVTFHGEFVRVTDIEIDIVHGERAPKHVPIYIGA